MPQPGEVEVERGDASYSAGFELHYERFNSGDARAMLPALVDLAAGIVSVSNVVLDLCCGTGDVVLRLAQEGYEAVGVDGSDPMLRTALSKVGQLSNARLVASDVRQFRESLNARLVTCLNGSVNQMLDEPSAIALFRAAAGALASDGAFVFDVFSRDYLDDLDGVQAVQDSDDVICVVKCETNASGVMHARLSGAIRDDNGSWVRFRQTIANRFYSDELLAWMLSEAGLVVSHATLELDMPHRKFLVAAIPDAGAEGARPC